MLGLNLGYLADLYVDLPPEGLEVVIKSSIKKINDNRKCRTGARLIKNLMIASIVRKAKQIMVTNQKMQIAAAVDEDAEASAEDFVVRIATEGEEKEVSSKDMVGEFDSVSAATNVPIPFESYKSTDGSTVSTLAAASSCEFDVSPNPASMDLLPSSSVSSEAAFPASMDLLPSSSVSSEAASPDLARKRRRCQEIEEADISFTTLSTVYTRAESEDPCYKGSKFMKIDNDTLIPRSASCPPNFHFLDITADVENQRPRSITWPCEQGYRFPCEETQNSEMSTSVENQQSVKPPNVHISSFTQPLHCHSMNAADFPSKTSHLGCADIPAIEATS